MSRKHDDEKESLLERLPTSIEDVKESLGEARESLHDARESFQESREQLLQKLSDTTHEIKPALRGWFHLLSIPFAFIGIMILLVVTESLKARGGIAIFGFGLMLLLSVSSTYHRSNGWVSAKWHSFLHRMDHASISILIPASCTPFALLLLDKKSALILLALIWSFGLAASISRIFFRNTPRFLSVTIYIGIGVIPLFFMPKLYRGAMDLGAAPGLWIFWLLVAGGIVYIVGAVLYAWRPPWTTIKENVFSYHEMFHLFTVIAFGCHYASVAIISANV